MRHLGILFVERLAIAIPARAQQKTGPGITGDDSLTWHGITLYGVIDIGVSHDTHSAIHSLSRPSASGNNRAAEQRRVGDGSYTCNMGRSGGAAGHRTSR